MWGYIVQVGQIVGSDGAHGGGRGVDFVAKMVSDCGFERQLGVVSYAEDIVNDNKKQDHGTSAAKPVEDGRIQDDFGSFSDGSPSLLE